MIKLSREPQGSISSDVEMVVMRDFDAEASETHLWDSWLASLRQKASNLEEWSRPDAEPSSFLPKGICTWMRPCDLEEMSAHISRIKACTRTWIHALGNRVSFVRDRVLEGGSSQVIGWL